MNNLNPPLTSRCAEHERAVASAEYLQFGIDWRPITIKGNLSQFNSWEGVVFMH